MKNYGNAFFCYTIKWNFGNKNAFMFLSVPIHYIYIVFGINVCLAINHSLYQDEPALNIILPLFMGIARECLITGTIHYFSILSIGYSDWAPVEHITPSGASGYFIKRRNQNCWRSVADVDTFLMFMYLITIVWQLCWILYYLYSVFLCFTDSGYFNGRYLQRNLLTYLGFRSQAKRQISSTSAIISRMKFLRLDSKYNLSNMWILKLLLWS
jgi:hypothetical protein